MSLIKDLTFRLLGVDESASSTMDKAGGVAEKATSRIGGAFSRVGGQIGGEFGEILSRTGEGIERMGSKTERASAVMMGAGGVITGLGVALQQAGSADKQAADQLRQAIETSGHSYGSYREEIEKTIATQENYGHKASDTQQALQKMTTAFGDPKRALEQMGLVANLAASKHISLADAAGLVDKVVAGKGTRTLTEYGITMGKGKDKTVEAQKALEELSHKVDGQASASMNNFGAQVGVVKTKLGDWTADIGQKVGPALTVIGPILMGAAAAMDIFKAANLGARIATLASSAATGIATAAQWAWNIALDANPIGLVVLAIAALVTGLVFFFTQTKLGKEVWQNVTQFIGQAVSWLWNSVLHPTFTAIGAIFTWLYQNIIQPYVNLMVLEFKVLAAVAMWLWTNGIQPTFQFIGNALHGLQTGFSIVFGAIAIIIRGAFSGALDFIRGAINNIIGLINGAIGALNVVGGAAKAVGLGGFHLTTIHKLATGGIVTGPTHALIGESGPEAVIPLNAGIPGIGGGGGGGGLHIEVHVNAGMGDKHTIAKAVSDAIIDTIRRGGISAAELRAALGV